MRICINLFPVGGWGGVVTFCRWIVAIPQYIETRYHFEVLLDPYQGVTSTVLKPGPACDPFEVAANLRKRSRLRRLYHHPAFPAPVRRLWGVARSRLVPQLSDPAARGRWLEAKRFDLIHCPYQWIDPQPPHQANRPYCINLHDLQHEHFPQFFSPQELEVRRTLWVQCAKSARAIFAVADHVKADIVHYCGVRPEKVHVVWPGPPFSEMPEVTDARRTEVRRKFALPERFFMYPAITWMHKNHARLLQAVARVNERRGYRINLVFSGSEGPQHAAVLAEVARLSLDRQVQYLGNIPYDELHCLYTLADATVVPTLYEASSAPVYEALAMGCPVACSAVANLPWLVDHGRAGLLFDPLDVEAIAAVLERLWEDAALRRRLAKASLERVKAFSWKSFAEGYIRGYERAIAGEPR